MSMIVIGKKVGRSKGWVHCLIKWREGGFQGDTPFGPASKKAREKKKQREARPPRGKDTIKEAADDDDESDAPEDEDLCRNAEPDEGEEQDDEDDGIWPAEKPSATVELCGQLDKIRRRGLIESLENLGSNEERARLAAAKNVVQYQNATGVAWNVLLIPAYEDRKR